MVLEIVEQLFLRDLPYTHDLWTILLLREPQRKPEAIGPPPKRADALLGSSLDTLGR